MEEVSDIKQAVSVAQLLNTLECLKSSKDDRIDVYLKVVSHISKDIKYFVEDLSRSAVLVLKHIKVDLKRDESPLLQAALQALGYILHHQDIVSSFSGSILIGILEDLFALMKDTKDKGVCTRSLWCLSRQNIPVKILAEKLWTLLSLVEMCILSKHFESSSVEFEALNVIKRMISQFPEEMATNKDDWFRLVYPFVISKAPKVADSALSVMEQNIQMIQANSANFSKTLISDLKEGLTERLRVLFSKNKELYVMRVWSCFITILDKVMHQGSPLTNSLFKVVEQAFKTNSSEVLIAAYKAWTTLIDNFATSRAAIRSKKRLKLLLMPLVNSTAKSERDPNVEKARLDTWWHLICILRNDLDEAFEQVVAPFLLFIFSAEEPIDTKVDLKLLKTPTGKPNVDNSKISTPGTPACNQYNLATKSRPKTSNVHFESNQLKLIGAEILYSLLKPENGEELLLKINKEKPIFKRLSVETFKNSSVLFYIALQDLTIHCGKDLEDTLLLDIWSSYCQYITEIANSDEKENLTVSFGGLLQSLERLVEIDGSATKIALQIITNCYLDLNEMLKKHRGLLKTDSNPQGSFAMHIFQMLFSGTRYINGEYSSSRKFFRLVDNVIKEMMSGAAEQLTMCHKIIGIISDMACYFQDKEPLWRFWDTTVNIVQKYINRTNDINQGTNLQHDFAAMLELLLFPIKNLLDANLPLAMSKAIDANWEKLFSVFVREAALVATVDKNQAVQDICFRIDLQFKNEQLILKKLKFIGRLIDILKIIAEKLEYGDIASENQVGTTPSKTKNQSNLGNAKSLIVIILRILYRLAHLDDEEIDSKMVDQHIGAVLHLIRILFTKIVGENLIKEAIERFSNPMIILLTTVKSPPDSKSAGILDQDKKVFINKQIHVVRKVLDAIYNCILERYGAKIDSQLLVSLTPLLKLAFGSDKEFIRSRVCGFWNKSFGLVRHLHYPEDLKKILNEVKNNVQLLLPGFRARCPNVDLDISNILKPDELSEGSVLSQSPKIKTAASLMRSPHKVHGSFLQKSLSAVKVTTPPSSRNPAVVKSPKSEPRRQAVRRKLPISIATNDTEFVRIAPSPKKRRILTEHQKEVMGLKSAIPVLYNQLDQATQDAIISDDTQFTQDSFPPKFGKEDPSPKKDVANPLSMDSNAELVEDSEQLFEPLPTEPKADILGKIIKSSPKQDSLSPKNVELSSKQTDEGQKNLAPQNATVNACAVDNKDGSLDTNGVRTSPRSLKKKQAKNYVASTKSAKSSSISKPKARRSVAKTFKNFLSSLSSEDEIAKESVESMETDDKTSEAVVIPSSYTFSETSTVDQAIPFTFSTGSYFSSKDKASSSTIFTDNAPVVVADTVENESDNLVTKSCSLTGSTSPDFIPSSQSQKDLTPVLTGISLIKPRRRSARKSKVIVTEDVILQVSKPPIATAVVDKALPNERDATKDIVDSKAEGDLTRIPEEKDLDNSVAEETLGNTQVTEATEMHTVDNTEVIADDANVHKEDSNKIQTCSTQKSNGQDLTSQKQTDVPKIIEPDVPVSNFTDQPLQQGPTQQLKVVIDKLVLEKDLCSDSNNKDIEDCSDVEGKSKSLRVVKLNFSSQTDSNLCDDERTDSARPVLDSSACDSLDNIESTDLVAQDDKRTTPEQNLCHEIPHTHPAVVDSKSKSEDESCALEETSSETRNEEKRQPTEVAELSSNRQALEVTNKKSDDRSSRKKNVARKRRRKSAKKVEDDTSTLKSPSKSNEGVRAKALKQTPDINEAQFNVDKSAKSLKDVSIKALIEASERQSQNDEITAYLAKKEIDTPKEKGDDQSVFINVVKTLKSFLQETPKSNQCQVAGSQVSCSNPADELGSDSEQQRPNISKAGETTATASSEELTQKETAKVLDDSDDSQSLINGKTPIVLTKERTRAAVEVDSKSPLVKTPSKEVNSPKTNKNSKNTDLEPIFYAKDLGFVAESLKNLHDIDSSFEDQLSLSTIKKIIQTPIVIYDTDPDSEPFTRKIDLTESANQCQTEATVAGSCAKEQENAHLEPDLSIVAMVGAEVKCNEKRKISRKRKRDLVDDPEEMDSETIEGIFKSADKPSECPSVNTSFQIIESKETTVQENQMVDLEKSSPVKLIKEKDTRDVVSGKTKTKGAGCVQENALLSMVCQAELVPTKNARNTRSAKSPRFADRKDDVCVSSVNCAPEKPIPVLVVDGELAVQNNDEKSTSALSDKQFPPISFAQPRRDCSSPLQVKRITTATSPSLSPISGILKKRLAKKNESPSPTNKNRRVSFAYPLEEKRSINDDKNDKNAELAVPLPDDKASSTSSGNGTPKRLTSLKRKYTSPKVISQIPGTPICSELITCSTPIEKLLPSLTSATWSRGLGNIIRAQNIRTIGNLCALSETQIEGLPIRSPKVNVVKKALKKFQTDKTKLEKKEISWNGIQGADSPLSAMTPTKPKEQTDQLNHKGTPSRKGLPKPTSLFPDKSNDKSGDKHDPVVVDSVVPLEVAVQCTDKNLNSTPTSTVSLETHEQNEEHQLEAIEDSNVPGVNAASNTFAPATVLGPTGENRMKDVEETVVPMETCADIKDNRTSVFVVSVSPVATQGQNREIHLKLATDPVTALTACAQEDDNKAAIAASSAAKVATHIEEKEQYTVTENMQEEAVNNDVIAKTTPSCNDELKAALSAVEAEMTNERLSQLSAHDSFLIHEKLTELSKRVFDSLRSKMTEQAVENK